jgi:hypothetical protein
MREQRPQYAGKKFAGREQAPAPKLDSALAISEIKRFLGVALREMGLELQYDVTEPAMVDARAGETDVLVMFHGPDQDLLLEEQAELLSALEHVADLIVRTIGRIGWTS